jgi:hypothetical protein
MAVQPRELLGDIGAVGEEHDLLDHPLVLGGDVLQAGKLDPLEQLLAEPPHHLRRLGPDPGDGRRHVADAEREVRRHRLAFAAAHRVEPGERRPQRGLHRRPERTGLGLGRLGDLDHAGAAHQHFERHAAGETEPFRESAELGRIGCRQCRVDLRRLGDAWLFQHHLDLDPSARDHLVDLVADTAFERLQLARQTEHDLRLFPVHRLQLDDDFRAVDGMFAPAVAGHGSHRGKMRDAPPSGDPFPGAGTPQRTATKRTQTGEPTSRRWPVGLRWPLAPSTE